MGAACYVCIGLKTHHILYSPSACHRDLYLTTHNTHNRQTSMSSVEFEPTVPASERPQTLALDRPATAIGTALLNRLKLAVSAVVDTEIEHGCWTGILVRNYRPNCRT